MEYYFAIEVILTAHYQNNNMGITKACVLFESISHISAIKLYSVRSTELLNHRSLFNMLPFMCRLGFSEKCYETLHLRYYDTGESWGRIHMRNVEQCTCVAGEINCERVHYTSKTCYQLLLLLHLSFVYAQ